MPGGAPIQPLLSRLLHLDEMTVHLGTTKRENANDSISGLESEEYRFGIESDSFRGLLTIAENSAAASTPAGILVCSVQSRLLRCGIPVDWIHWKAPLQGGEPRRYLLIELGSWILLGASFVSEEDSFRVSEPIYSPSPGIHWRQLPTRRVHFIG